MDKAEFDARVREVKARAHGHWTGILRTLGVDEKVLNKRNQPCPLNGCGGTDRFQYTDRFGEGNYHCRGCGAGGGFKLLQGYHGWDFGTALRRVEECVGSSAASSGSGSDSPSPERMKQLAKRIWNEAVPIATGDEVDRYLRHRGLQLASYPRTLRFHPALGYYVKEGTSGKSKKVGEYPAMLACIQGMDGHAVTLHRTYLKDGAKALGCESKKVLCAGINGAAVRLGQATDELAVTEGIETGLAIHRCTGKPVWAATSAGNLEKLWIPDSVERVFVYADNDADTGFDGQASAFILARRLKKKTSRARHVEVFVPKTAGTDWADVWLSRLQSVDQAA